MLREYSQAMRAVARDQDVAFIDLLTLLTPSDLADGLHPNASGYEKMYGAIHTAIQSDLA